MTDPTYDELLDIVDAQRKLIESLGRKNQWLMEQMPIRRADLLAALGAEWRCAEKWDTDNYPCPPDSTVHGCVWVVRPKEEAADAD